MDMKSPKDGNTRPEKNLPENYLTGAIDNEES